MFPRIQPVTWPREMRAAVSWHPGARTSYLRVAVGFQCARVLHINTSRTEANRLGCGAHPHYVIPSLTVARFFREHVAMEAQLFSLYYLHYATSRLTGISLKEYVRRHCAGSSPVFSQVFPWGISTEPCLDAE